MVSSKIVLSQTDHSVCRTTWPVGFSALGTGTICLPEGVGVS